MTDAIGHAAACRPPVTLGTKITLIACALFTLLTGASISPALPAISVAFADEPNAVLLTKLVLTVSPLFIALGGPFWGLLIDRWSRRSALIIAILGTASFGLLGAFMNSLAGLIACRAMLGLSVSGVTACCYTLMVDLFDGKERDRFMGVQAAAQKLGGLFFVLLGGVLAAISWRATFAVDVIVLLVLPGVLLTLKEPTRERSRVPADLASLNWRVVTVVWLAGFLGQAIFFTIPTQIPFLLIDRMGASPILVGIAIATSALSGAAAASQYHRVHARLGFPAIFGATFLILAPSFALIGIAQSPIAVIIALAVGGTGFGMLLPNMTVWIVEGVHDSARGRAIGIMMTAIFLGQFASPLMAQPFVATLGVQRLFTLIAGLLLVAAAILILPAVIRRSPAHAGRPSKQRPELS